MGLFDLIFGSDDTPENVIQDCKTKIRAVLNVFDLKEGEHWNETEEGFIFKSGSAVVLIGFTVDEDGDPHITVHSPIVKLPSDNLLPFYRRLLEINWELHGRVTVGVVHDTVVVCAIRDIEGLNEIGLAEVTGMVGSVADTLDDALHEEFGAPLFELGEEE